MKTLSAQYLSFLSVVVLLASAWEPVASAETVPVRYTQGAFHGFLELRSEDGKVVAVGDSTSLARGGRVTAETVFHFKDDSLDDDIAVFTQNRTFQLVSDHHIQKGPAFPHPTDVMIDVHSGTVTVRTPGKDGKEEVKTDHVTLPPDLYNGIVSQVIGSMASKSQTLTISQLVLIPKPRVVKLVITKVGEEECSVLGAPRKATRYDIKVDLGGIVGVVAPLIGKAPPNISFWVIGGVAPTFAKEEGPLYPEGPIMTIRLASPVWEK